MKVSFCPNCRISPDITAELVKCPKCGKTAKGNSLTETVTNWNEGKYSTATVIKAVVEEKPVEDPPVETEKAKPKKRKKRSE